MPPNYVVKFKEIVDAKLIVKRRNGSRYQR